MTLDLTNLPDKIYVKPHGLPAPTNGLGTFYGTNWGKAEEVEYVRRYSLPLTQVELSKFREDHPLDGPALVALAAWANVKPNQLPKEMQAHNCPDTMAAWGRVAQALKQYYGDRA